MEQLIARATEGVSQQAGPVRMLVTRSFFNPPDVAQTLCIQGLITAPEAEHTIQALQSFSLDQVYRSCLHLLLGTPKGKIPTVQVGSHAWRNQHGQITQLNLQVTVLQFVIENLTSVMFSLYCRPTCHAAHALTGIICVVDAAGASHCSDTF